MLLNTIPPYGMAERLRYRDRLADGSGDAHVPALTRLEDKIGEVIGLAMAAQVAIGLVVELTRELDPDLAERLDEMKDEAAETEGRATELADTFDGKKPAIL